MNIPLIFDRQRLIKQRCHSAANFSQYNFLYRYVADDLIERVDCSKFTSILNLGYNGGEIAHLLTNKVIHTDISLPMLNNVNGDKVVCDEEILPFVDNSFDLVISNLILHLVNDLPGALIQIKNVLKESGIFIGAIFGGNTLIELKESFIKTELLMNVGHSPHIFPFIDVKQMGMLMKRAGFYLPVADREIVTVTYQDIFALFADLKGIGQNSNILISRNKKYLGRNFFTKLDKIYKECYLNMDKKIIVSFEIIKFMGIKK